MPDIAAVKTKILANVNSVTDIGTVHEYERYAKNQVDMRALYQKAIGGVDQIRGWHLVELAKKTRSAALHVDDVRTVWELRGFMSLDDSAASELTFDLLVELIRTTMRADPDLGGVANTHDSDSEEAGWQVVEKNKVMFAGVLCHHARLQLVTWHTE